MIVEEDTGEIILIPLPFDEQKINKELNFVETKKILPGYASDELNALNPIIPETFPDKQLEELNENLFDDLLSNNTFNDIKIDESWIKNFLESPRPIQTPTTESLNLTLFNNLIAKNTSFQLTSDTQQSFNFTQTEGLLLTPDKTPENTSFNYECKFYDKKNGLIWFLFKIIICFFQDFNTNIDNLLKNSPQKFVESRLLEELDSLINNNEFSALEGDQISNLNFVDEERNNDDNESLISSTNSEDENSLDDKLQTVFKQEPTMDEALFGFQHNHTYLETRDDGVYHPHSYKNRMKNSLNASNRLSRDELLLKQNNIDYTLEKIVNSNVEVFNEILRNPKLNAAQLNILKDIRRRGKNKIAAKTCRKRKIDSIDTLKEDVEGLRKKKRQLEIEREKIQQEVINFEFTYLIGFENRA